MSKLELIYTIALAIFVVVLLIYYIIMAIKNGWIKKLTETLNVSMKYAEDNITGSAEKKKYVMEQIESKCIELGIPYTLISKLISSLIEKIIANHNIIDH